MIEVEYYLEESLDVLTKEGDELRIRHCLWCGRHRTLKVNVRRRRFICHHGRCAERGGLVKLIMQIEGCDRNGARRVMGDLAKGIVQYRKPRGTAAELKERLSTPPPEPKRLSADLPEEFVRCWDGKRWQIPTYLTKVRRLKKSTIKRWGIGFCRKGDYASRVVVPVRCAGETTFVARATVADAVKYKNPQSADSGRVLFGYDELVPDKPVVVVEGVFDAMRLWSWGHQAVATLHLGVSDRQALLLERCGSRPVILMPDASAVLDWAKQAPRLIHRLPSLLLASLPAGDPDSSTQMTVLHSLRGSVPASGITSFILQLQRLKGRDEQLEGPGPEHFGSTET